MAVPTNTFSPFPLSETVKTCSTRSPTSAPTDVPFTTMAGTATAKASFHEWQTDSLATLPRRTRSCRAMTLRSPPHPRPPVSATARRSSRKEVIVSGTQDAVDKAGAIARSSIRWQARDELKRDKEFVFLLEPGSGDGQLGHGAAASPAVRVDHDQRRRGTGGANGTSSAAATDGTQRASRSRW
jgi:hypothetical protein